MLRVIRRTNLESGGPIEGLLRSSEALLSRGHHVEVLSLESPQDVVGRGFPFPVHALGRGFGRYSFNRRLVPWLDQNLERFDAVILHGLWNYSSLGSWRSLCKTKVPYYIYAHGMMDPWFCDQHPLKHLAKQLFWSAGEGRVLRDAAAVLFTSEEERLRARGVFRGYSYKERVVLYGTADPLLAARSGVNSFFTQFPRLSERALLLCISRIHPIKGCDLLIRAFAAVLPELPGNLDLVIAGPDQVGLVPRLQHLAGSLGVAGRIHWPGMLKGDLKWDAFLVADALILPSHHENFGIVVAEAMACARPVLITNKVNIWREVEAAHAGMVEPDTEAGIANLMRRFFASAPETRARMGADARSAFLRNFQIDAVAEDLLRVIGQSTNSRLSLEREVQPV